VSKKMTMRKTTVNPVWTPEQIVAEEEGNTVSREDVERTVEMYGFPKYPITRERFVDLFVGRMFIPDDFFMARKEDGTYLNPVVRQVAQYLAEQYDLHQDCARDDAAVRFVATEPYQPTAPGVSAPAAESAFVRQGTETGRIRKQTVRHLGRATAEEKAATAEWRTLSGVRSLGVLLTDNGIRTEDVPHALKAVKHWLMDAENDRRTKGQLDEQDLVGRLVDLVRACEVGAEEEGN
jgi:hypothetical protein